MFAADALCAASSAKACTPWERWSLSLQPQSLPGACSRPAASSQQLKHGLRKLQVVSARSQSWTQKAQLTFSAVSSFSCSRICWSWAVSSVEVLADFLEPYACSTAFRFASSRACKPGMTHARSRAPPLPCDSLRLARNFNVFDTLLTASQRTNALTQKLGAGCPRSQGAGKCMQNCSARTALQVYVHVRNMDIIREARKSNSATQSDQVHSKSARGFCSLPVAISQLR